MARHKRVLNIIFYFVIALFIFSCNKYVYKNEIEEYKTEDILSEKFTDNDFYTLNYNLFNGGEVIFLTSQTSGQMESLLIRTKNNKFLIFDGGRYQDAYFLCEVIKTLGGDSVEAWFITHSHDDHVGALYETVKENYIDIKSIYYKFPPIEWCYEKIGDDAGYLYLIYDALNEYKKKLNDLGKEINIYDDIKRAEKFVFDGVEVEIINDMYMLDSDSINNSSIIYKINVYGSSIIFLGDISYYGSIKLIEDVSEKKLKSDVVVLSHHGQNGAPYELYKIIDAKYALWPTTKKIYENREGKYATDETKKWFEEFGTINVLSFEGNYIIK